MLNRRCINTYILHLHIFRLGLNNMKKIEFSFISENLQISFYISAFLSHFKLFLIFITRFSLSKYLKILLKCIIMVVRRVREPSSPWSLKWPVFITTKDGEEGRKTGCTALLLHLLTILCLLLCRPKLYRKSIFYKLYDCIGSNTDFWLILRWLPFPPVHPKSWHRADVSCLNGIMPFQFSRPTCLMLICGCNSRCNVVSHLVYAGWNHSL